MDILIVEDNKRERERLASILNGSGYSVHCVENAEDAEKYISLEQVKVVILDIGLTDRSGSVLFAEIRKSQPQAKIIIFTGNPSPFLKQRFIAEGASDYIVKGSIEAGDQEFISLVSELMPKSSLAPEALNQCSFPLASFLRDYVEANSSALFLDINGQFPPCKNCGGSEYGVSFKDKLQIPPQLIGTVKCNKCGNNFEHDVRD